MEANTNDIEIGGNNRSFFEKLAFDKKLPVEYLEPTVVDCGDHFIILYHHKDGRLARPRVRYATGKSRFTWAKYPIVRWTGGLVDDLEIVPYGLCVLPRLDENFCILGEGESDGWACFYHDFPYIGIPGASNYRCLQLEHISRFQRMFIHQEPDEAGARFARESADWLRKIGYLGEILIFDLGEFGVKDPSDLHAKSPQRFRECLMQALDNARLASVPKEPEQPPRATRQTYDRFGLDSDLTRLDLDEIITRDIGPSHRSGKWNCPFHDDRSPSLNTYTGRDGKQRFKCFGCGAQGDAIAWVRMRFGASFSEACQSLGISTPTTNGVPKIHVPLSGRSSSLPDRETCHSAPTRSGGSESSDSQIDQERNQQRALALQDCPNRRQVVIRKTEDLQVVKIAVCCKQMRCLYCRAKWISDRLDHYEEVLLDHAGDLFFACVPAEIWNKIQRQLKREGAEYIAIRNHRNQRIVISNKNALGGSAILAAQAIRLISEVLNAIDETIKKPLLASATWRHPSGTTESKKKYRLVCNTVVAKEELIRKCGELEIELVEKRWDKLDIDVLHLGIEPTWSDEDVQSFFATCEIEDFALAIGRNLQLATPATETSTSRGPVQQTFQFERNPRMEH